MYLIDGVEGKQNLRVIYESLNKDYFGNSLPNIKLRWDGRLKKAIGRASVKYITNEYRGRKPEITTDSLTILLSKAYDLNYNDVLAVMLHEMAHIQLYLNNILNKHHGTSMFDGLIIRLRKESGINVPMKESSFKTSPTATAIEGYVAIIHTGGGMGLTVYSTPFIKKNWRGLSNFFDVFIPSGKIRKIELWKVKHPLIKNSTKKRSLKRISWSNAENDEVESVKKSGFQWGEYGPGKNWTDGRKAGL